MSGSEGMWGRRLSLISTVVLAGWLGMAGTVCIFGPTCSLGMAWSTTETFIPATTSLNRTTPGKHPEYAHDRARGFRATKKVRQGQERHTASVLPGMRGLIHLQRGMPKNRFSKTPDGLPGLNYLCEGYKGFFEHADKPMRIMAGLIRANRPASEVMAILAREEGDLNTKFAGAGRNDLCPCGSGVKFKKCAHGNQAGHR